jgi:hypothetical protein
MAAEKAKRGKAGRVRDRLFAGRKAFDSNEGRYSSLPWVFRRVLGMFPPRTWQVYSYLVLRSGREALTWQTDRQIAVDIEVTHRKIAPHLKDLQKMGFIDVKEYDGERYVFLLDPMLALDAMATDGRLCGDRLERLNEDLETIGLPTVPIQPEQPTAAQPAATRAPEASQSTAAAPKRSPTTVFRPKLAPTPRKPPMTPREA